MEIAGLFPSEGDVIPEPVLPSATDHGPDHGHAVAPVGAFRPETFPDLVYARNGRPAKADNLSLASGEMAWPTVLDRAHYSHVRSTRRVVGGRGPVSPWEVPAQQAAQYQNPSPVPGVLSYGDVLAGSGVA